MAKTTFKEGVLIASNIILAVAVLILLLKSFNEKPCPQVQVVKFDTVYKPIPEKVIQGPVPVSKEGPLSAGKHKAGKVWETEPAEPIESQNGSEFDFAIAPGHEPSSVVPQNSISIYRDSFQFKDDAGYMILRDSVEGIIHSREYSYVLNKISVKDAPAKSSLYVGIRGMAGIKSTGSYIGAEAAFQPKNRKNLYGVGYGWFNGQQMASGTIMIKL